MLSPTIHVCNWIPNYFCLVHSARNETANAVRCRILHLYVRHSVYAMQFNHYRVLVGTQREKERESIRLWSYVDEQHCVWLIVPSTIQRTRWDGCQIENSFVAYLFVAFSVNIRQLHFVDSLSNLIWRPVWTPSRICRQYDECLSPATKIICRRCELSIIPIFSEHIFGVPNGGVLHIHTDVSQCTYRTPNITWTRVVPTTMTRMHTNTCAMYCICEIWATMRLFCFFPQFCWLVTRSVRLAHAFRMRQTIKRLRSIQ